MPRRKTLYREALRGLASLRSTANPVVVPPGMPATVEVGMGAGHVLVARAQAEPGRWFVGLEIKEERAYQAARVAEAAKLGNIVFVVGEISRTDSALPAHRFDELMILFPDPWPRKRDVGRRIFGPRYLQIYARWMEPGAHGILRSDNPGVFELALDGIAKSGCAITSTSEDVAPGLHQTRYEARFRQEAQPIREIRFRFPADVEPRPKASAP
jgi:tRNA (guanine-N7-)-methyltransferase